MRDISLRFTRRAAVLALLAAAMAGLNGCNTMQGVGQDIESIGQNMSVQAHHWSAEWMSDDSPEGY